MMVGENEKMILPEELEMIINEYSKPHYRYNTPIISELMKCLFDREFAFKYNHNGDGETRYDYFMDNIKKADNREWIPDERTLLMRSIKVWTECKWATSYFDWRDVEW